MHDLAVSKLAACRDKDLAYVEVMVRFKIASAKTVRDRMEATCGIPDETRKVALARLERWALL